MRRSARYRRHSRQPGDPRLAAATRSSGGHTRARVLHACRKNKLRGSEGNCNRLAPPVFFWPLGPNQGTEVLPCNTEPPAPTTLQFAAYMYLGPRSSRRKQSHVGPRRTRMLSKAKSTLSVAPRLAKHGSRRTIGAARARHEVPLRAHDFDAHYSKLAPHRVLLDTVDMVMEASASMAMDLAPLNNVADAEAAARSQRHHRRRLQGGVHQYYGDEALATRRITAGRLPNWLALMQSEMLATANFASSCSPACPRAAST